jgi:hypothetical protein
MNQDIERQLQIHAISSGEDYFGVADLTPARDFIHKQGGERVSRYPRGIVIGMRLQDSLVDLLPEDDKAAAILYKHNSYDVVNQSLDQIALWIANTLQRAGYGAFPVPASKRTDDGHICGIFSQKLAARLAGLGWIGKSCLLVTPDHGPRVRWVTVLTDAPLKPTGFPMEPRCGKCTACIDISRSMRSPADRSALTSPVKPGSMRRCATVTLRSRKKSMGSRSAASVSGSARMG